MKDSFSEILSRYREARELSRTDLANLVSLDGSYIHRLEAGNRRPSRKTVMMMADALDLDDETLSRWLFASGYGPLPGAAHGDVQHVRRQRDSANRKPLKTTAARRLTRLESIGFEPGMLNRLVQAVERLSPDNRKQISALVSRMLRMVCERLETPIRAAVIPAAGPSYGGATVIKQRLLIRAVGEAAQCGIHEVVLVLAPDMDSFLFTPLKEAFEAAGIGSMNLRFCTQLRPNGLGEAILTAESLVGDQPFAVLLPDDVIDRHLSRSTNTQQLRLMIDAFQRLPRHNLLAVTSVSRRKMPRYGVVEAGKPLATNGVLEIRSLIEKPDQTHAIVKSPNALGIVGRYLLQPKVFEVLRRVRKLGQPLELTTALESIRKQHGEIGAFPLKGARRDLGEEFGRATEALGSHLQQS